MRLIFTFVFLCLLGSANCQLLSWSPQFMQEASSPIVITMDGTRGNQALKDYLPSQVYVHIGVITTSSANSADWKYSKFAWATTPAEAKAAPAGTNKWTYTINGGLRTFFGMNNPAEKILRIAILFRNSDGSIVQRNADQSDMYVPVYDGAINAIQFTQPFMQPTYNITHEAISAGLGVSVPVTAVASGSGGTLNLYFNGAKISGPISGTNTITGNATATVKGNQQIVSEYILGGISYYDTVSYYIALDNNIAALPANVKEGINYNANCTSVTLVLYAPNKTNVVVVGDFPGSNWVSQTQYQMNKTPDGNYYWLTINGLVSGTEYAFNYVVDQSIYVADPYSEKILDPNNDQYIPSATYPNLKPYPTNSNVSAGKNGIVSVLQPCAPAYNWQVNNFVKPDKRNLMIYELLVRDFGDAKNYQMLIDTISYFKRLGINAIELMPVNEFAGNESWGYNPTFYCALDKAYGTKNKFKEFIDLCHQNGIAVILDVVYNHMDAFSTPQGKMYWNNGKPAANSPWFNQSAPHPYSVFEDLNHTSPATQYLVERSLDYWLSEYKIDGYRFDLGKGFTQKATNGGTVEDYDASRVTNLNRYYDYVLPKYPNTYMIIEFLGQQRQEEQEYANHGFMLWGNSNFSYNQATKGFASGSNFSKVVYNSNEAQFSQPAGVGYMESHDEERLMYRNLTEGNNSGGYNVKTLATALEREAAAAALFFTVPGPKMIWQFGERGYDLSINFGGSNVSSKPPRWEYMQDANRLKLWDAYSKLIRLRLSYPSTFNNTNFDYDFYDNNGLVKRFQIADPNGGLKVTVVANFDVVAQTRTINFQSTGAWYSYLSNGTGSGLNGATGTTFNLGSTSQSITLQPGEYHVFLDRQAVLPLKLLSFTGKRNSSNISLAWITANEVNVKNFELQRSTNGVDFAAISKTQASNSLSQQQLNYNTIDSDPVAVNATGKVYYRLKIVDNDGAFAYSSIAVINPSSKKTSITLYPNPVKGSQLYINIDQASQSQVSIKIEDITGRLYNRYTVSMSNYSNGIIPINIGSLSNGAYILKFETDKKTTVKQFIINR
jgi:1,4-alpha-glucan branching enzyme